MLVGIKAFEQIFELANPYYVRIGVRIFIYPTFFDLNTLVPILFEVNLMREPNKITKMYIELIDLQNHEGL